MENSSVLPKNLPAEFEILLSSARLFFGTSEATHLENLLNRQQDWLCLLNLSKRHGLMPLLYWSVSITDFKAVPENVLAHIRNEFRINSKRNLLITTELIKILELLKKNDIRVTSLKGPALAMQAYGDISFRQFADLDILIDHEDVEIAIEVLQNQGYTNKMLMPQNRMSLIKGGYDYELYNRALQLTIELHWEISERLFRQEIDAASIIARSVNLSFLGNNLVSPCIEDLLLLSCHHGSKHAWDRLSLPCDVAGLIITKDIDFDFLFEQAQRPMDHRALLLGLILIKELFLIPIDEAVQKNKYWKDMKKIAEIAVKKNIFAENSLGYNNSQKFRRFIFYTNMFEQPYEKLSYLTSLIIFPSQSDISSIELPATLYPLYYFIRPLRILNIFCSAVSEYIIHEYKSNKNFILSIQDNLKI
jgi:Uncharacterised nucleotidyltransferase